MSEEQFLTEKRYRVLDENNQLVPATLEEWSMFFENPRRSVGFVDLNRRRHIRVSTVCLGMDHGWREAQWFETMIFGTSIDGYCERYGTYKEALRGHAQAVRKARQARQTRYRMGTRKAFKKMMRDTSRILRAWKRAGMTKVTRLE